MKGLKGAFLKDGNNVELKTDNLEALKEWDEWKWFLDPNRARVIQQLEQRKSDPNLKLVVSLVVESQDALARYLARMRAMLRVKMVA